MLDLKGFVRIVGLVTAVAAALGGCGGEAADKVDEGSAEQEAVEYPENGDPAPELPEDGYPALELPDISDGTLTETESRGIRFSYQEDDWTLQDETSVRLIYSGSLDTDKPADVNINDNGPYGELTDEDLERVKSAQTESLNFMRANAAEFRSIDGEKVMYLDFDVSDMEAYLDFIIENVGLTEEDLEGVGGREGLLKLMPPAKSLMLGFVRDGELYFLSAIYYDDSQREAVWELFAAVYPSLERA